MNAKRVLIVDDHQPIAWALCQALGEDGYDACFANSGQEALQLAGERDFDLVFTDLKMPGMSGIEWVRKLRDRGSTAKVVVMTAHGSFETAVDALRLGVVDYLIKPVDVDQAKCIAAAALTAPAELPASGHETDSRPAHAQPPGNGDWNTSAAVPTQALALDIVPGDDDRAFNDVLKLSETEYAVSAGKVLGTEPTAGLYAVAAKGYVRSELARGNSPAQTLTRLNGLMLKDDPARHGVALFLGIYDTRRRLLVYAAGGPGRHLFLRSSQAQCQDLDATGPPLGILDGAAFAEASIPAGRQDRLVLSAGTLLLSCSPDTILSQLHENGTDAAEHRPSGRPMIVAATLGPAGETVEEQALDLPCTPSALTDVRARAERFARRARLAYAETHKLVTAVLEAAINCIVHGHTDTGSRLSARFTRTGNRVEAEIRDNGRGFDLSTYEPPNTVRYDEVMKARGRGIFLMRSLMHHVDIRSEQRGGTRVRMAMHLDMADRSAA